MLERAKKVTQDKYTHLEYARYADDLVVLIDGYTMIRFSMRQDTQHKSTLRVCVPRMSP